MKQISTLLIIFLLMSCSTDSKEDLNSFNKDDPNYIMEFENWEDFYKTHEIIGKLNDNELISWTENQGHDSYLLNSIETSIDILEKNKSEFYLTRSLEAILNEDLTFRVATDFIVLDHQTFYSFTEEEYLEFKLEKLGFKQENRIGEISVQKSIFNDTSAEQEDSKIIYMDAADVDGSYQKEFVRQGYIPCAGGANQGVSKYKFKYVHELVAIKVNVGYPNIIAELNLDVKLEFHNGSWNNAGENRNITIYVSGSAENTSNNPRYTNFAIDQNIKCRSSNVRVLLASAQYPSNFGSEPDWIVSGSGVITQQINGDTYSNKGTNYVNW